MYHIFKKKVCAKKCSSGNEPFAMSKCKLSQVSDNTDNQIFVPRSKDRLVAAMFLFPFKHVENTTKHQIFSVFAGDCKHGVSPQTFTTTYNGFKKKRRPDYLSISNITFRQ